jgi:NADH-quinone oxidoreductase subunit F
VASSIALFRDEYIAHIEGGGCPFDPRDSMLLTVDSAKGTGPQ